MTTLHSEEGDTLSPSKPYIQIPETFQTMSQMFIKKKTGKAQKKIFKVKFKGTDQAGKLTKIVKIELDLSEYQDSHNAFVTTLLVVDHDPDKLNNLELKEAAKPAKVSFKVTVALPSAMNVDLS